MLKHKNVWGVRKRVRKKGSQQISSLNHVHATEGTFF